MLEQVKQKLLQRVNNALDSGEPLNADTVGYFLTGIAKLEENEIIKSKEPLHYNKVVEDVNKIVEKLPNQTEIRKETI